MGRNSIISDANPIWWYLGRIVQIEDTWVCATQNRIRIVWHGDASEEIDAWLSEVENDGEKKYGSETPFTKLSLTPGMGELNLEPWSRVERDFQALKEEKVSVTSGKERQVFARRPLHQNTLPPRLLSQPYHEVEVCRGREVSEAKVTMGPFFDNRVDIIWRVPARERLVNIGIRPSANFYKTKRVVSQETRVCFRITRLINNHIKGRRKATSQKAEKVRTTALWLLWKSVSQLGFVLQDSDALASQGTKEFRRNQMQKVLFAIQRVRFTKSAASREYPGQERTIAWENTSQTSTSAKSLRNKIRGSVRRRDGKTRAMCPKPRLGILPKIYSSSKRTTRLHSSRLQKKWDLPSASPREPEEREFVVDSGASIHMVSEKDLTFAELETMRT